MVSTCLLYIVLFLHQTTTSLVTRSNPRSCISYYSYIKPQPQLDVAHCGIGCISYYSYIKPQLLHKFSTVIFVVYRTIPTSNHNFLVCITMLLYVVYRTIPTSNHNVGELFPVEGELYIVLFLHQTTTLPLSANHRTALYIVLFLHQTTTRFLLEMWKYGCISYYSYIKPQHYHGCLWTDSVVYRTIPTSNHNCKVSSSLFPLVVYRTIPTSNHNL